MRHRDADSPECMAFLEEQVQRCLTLQLISPTHSNQLRVEVDGDTHNTKGSVGDAKSDGWWSGVGPVVSIGSEEVRDGYLGVSGYVRKKWVADALKKIMERSYY